METTRSQAKQEVADLGNGYLLASDWSNDETCTRVSLASAGEVWSAPATSFSNPRKGKKEFKDDFHTALRELGAVGSKEAYKVKMDEQGQTERSTLEISIQKRLKGDIHVGVATASLERETLNKTFTTHYFHLLCKLVGAKKELHHKDREVRVKADEVERLSRSQEKIIEEFNQAEADRDVAFARLMNRVMEAHQRELEEAQAAANGAETEDEEDDMEEETEEGAGVEETKGEVGEDMQVSDAGETQKQPSRKRQRAAAEGTRHKQLPDTDGKDKVEGSWLEPPPNTQEMSSESFFGGGLSSGSGTGSLLGPAAEEGFKGMAIAPKQKEQPANGVANGVPNAASAAAEEEKRELAASQLAEDTARAKRALERMASSPEASSEEDEGVS